jgi:beta-phosphoglucomutase-like phosphatase (HAD superfamily)
MLTALRQMGLVLGIVTGKSRRSWSINAQHVTLGPIDLWVFDDDVAEIKPHPAGLRLALERLQLTPPQVIYLGDSLTDVEAAQAAGVVPGAVLWPKRPAEIAAFTDAAVARGASIFPTPMSVVDFCARTVPQSTQSTGGAQSCSHSRDGSTRGASTLDASH